MKYLKNAPQIIIHAEKCNGCSTCIEVCPREVISMVSKKAEIINRDNCMECGACAKNCNMDAIAVVTGVGCASAVISSMIRGGEPVCGCDSGSGSGCC